MGGGCYATANHSGNDPFQRRPLVASTRSMVELSPTILTDGCILSTISFCVKLWTDTDIVQDQGPLSGTMNKMNPFDLGLQ